MMQLLAVGQIGQFRLGMLFYDDHDLVWIAFLEALDLVAAVLEGIALFVRLYHI